MLGAPPGVATEEVIAAVRAVDGVRDVHNARFWQMQEHEAAFDAHIVIDRGAWREADAVKAAVKRTLADRFGIHQTTLELECAVHACLTAPVIGPEGSNH
jgi:cobalt-zinc-cadmium efflux system protein